MAAAWPGATSDHADETIPPRPVQDHVHRQRRPRSHATTAVIVLASLLAFLVAITIVLVLLRNSPSTTARTAVTPTVTNAASTKSLLAATQVADRNTNTTLLALHAMKGIPTPVTVSALINRYVTSLQSYANALSGANLPATVRPAAALALAQVAEYVQFVSTVNGLRAVNLGTYLEQFGKESALFQIALGTLEHHLGASTT
jgi:hypothetical protein